MSAKDDQSTQEKPQAQPNSKKNLLIIIGAIVIAVAVGAGATFFMLHGSSKEAGAKEGKAEKSEKTEKSEKGEKGEALNSYALDPFIVNIYDGQELRYLKLKLEIELSNAEVKNELTVRQAELRDAVLAILTTKTMQDIQFLQGKNQLKQEIMAAVTKMLSPGKVKQIYFTDFVVQ
jgi:flagellar FliL protein